MYEIFDCIDADLDLDKFTACDDPASWLVQHTRSVMGHIPKRRRLRYRLRHRIRNRTRHGIGFLIIRLAIRDRASVHPVVWV